MKHRKLSMRNILLGSVGFGVMVVMLFVSLIPDSGAADSSSSQPKGHLVIVGGALSPDNKEVYEAFLTSAEENRDKTRNSLRIGIMPTASSTPIESASSYKNDFLSYGVQEENVEIIPIALHDDPSTKEDESKWKDNATKKAVSSTIHSYDAIWFVGGNQLNYTSTLRTNDQEDTRALSAIRDIHRNGATLGGSSAGAAIMSSSMIGAGSSLGALSDGVSYKDTYGNAEDNRVFITDGIGFLEKGLVDQHFLERGRFGRLLVGALETGVEEAYGVDEDTAMVVDYGSRTIEVKGTSGVSIFDLRHATASKDFPLAMRNVRVSYLETGDTYHYDENTYDIHEKKSYITSPYYPASSTHTDIFASNALQTALTYDLVDSDSKEVTGIGFNLTSDKRGEGFSVTFTETEETKGYWGKINGEESYAAINVRMDVTPMRVKMKLKPVKEKQLDPVSTRK